MDRPTTSEERVRQVAAAYDRVAGKYAEARGPVAGAFRRLLDRLVEPLAPGVSILDAGCGHGVPARYLVDRGLRVTFFYSGHAPEASLELLEAAGFEIEHWEVDDHSSRGHIAVLGKVGARA